MLHDLLVDLEGFAFSLEEDFWNWKPEDNGFYSVHSMYRKLEEGMLEEENLSERESKIFAQIWKSPAPLKVVAFSWKLLHDRIPTRLNLLRRHSLPPDTSVNCVFCDFVGESFNHLFLHCEVASNIWREVLNWFGGNFVTPPNLSYHWDCWNGEIGDKKLRKWCKLIWHASVWAIWRVRNEKIFNRVIKNVDEIVEEIKVLSWK